MRVLLVNVLLACGCSSPIAAFHISGRSCRHYPVVSHGGVDTSSQAPPVAASSAWQVNRISIKISTRQGKQRHQMCMQVNSVALV